MEMLRDADIDPDLVLARRRYSHPVFDLGAIAAQRRRDEIQGVDGIFYVGAYWGYGFHEDGVRSALAVAACFGVGLEDLVPRIDAKSGTGSATWRAASPASQSGAVPHVHASEGERLAS